MLPDPFSSDIGRWGKWSSSGRASQWSREDAREELLWNSRDQSMIQEGGNKLKQTLNKVFAIHLHNQWEKKFPKGGWVDILLLKKYDKKLGIY